jgi:DNA replication and repair protein RecF
MYIRHIEIRNFRNYPDLSLEVTSGMVILSGPNAVGKTNLLESVYFGSLFKSFRDDSDFIFMRGQNTAELKLTVEKLGQTHTLEVFLEKRDRIYANFKIDGVKRKRKDAQGFIAVVIFEPTDVDLFSKPPEARRKYLNMVLSQKNLAYLDNLANYKRVLLQKNKLLQDGRALAVKQGELESWNEQLVQYGSALIQERQLFMNYLNQNLSEVYAGITKFHRSVEVVYETIAGDSVEDIQTKFRGILEQGMLKEVQVGQALYGPHRDDFYLQSEGLYLVPFSSRGELRSQVLALKVLELEYLTRNGDTPILLLDDVLSELDETRRTFLLKYMQDKFQTFITTTHPLEMAGQHVTLSPSPATELAAE